MPAKKKARNQLHPNNPNRKTDAIEFLTDLESLAEDVQGRVRDEVMQALHLARTGPVSGLKGPVLQHLKEAQGWLQAALDDVNSLIERVEE